MKQILIACIALTTLFISCTGNKKKPVLQLNSSNLKSAFISLSNDSAYTLKTPKGAILKIDKLSFDVKAGTWVQLEVKEAYNLQDMLLAGLTTESNGKLLNSGGMIYVNATANTKEIELVKPIKVSLPGTEYDENMQLFKGEIKSDSSINWINPQPLDTSPVAKALIRGEILFKANCASCHKVDKDFTGPALAGWRMRVPGGDWIYRYIANPSALRETDPYAKYLAMKWNPVIMTAFPVLGREDIDAIMGYVDNRALKYPSLANTATPAASINIAKLDSANPCLVNDTTFYPNTTATNSITIVSNDTTPKVIQSSNNTSLGKAEDNEGLRNGFTDPVSSSFELYEFTIETFGWYNVDAFVEGYAGTSLVSLNVQLQTTFKQEMHIYLFCPQRKMLSVSNVFNNNLYSFDKVNGKIPLFINDEAVLLAFGSVEDKLFYGTASIRIQSSQTTVITVKETTREQLASFIKLNKIDGIKIDADKKEMVFKQEPQVADSVPVEITITQIPCASDSSRKK